MAEYTGPLTLLMAILLAAICLVIGYKCGRTGK